MPNKKKNTSTDKAPPKKKKASTHKKETKKGKGSGQKKTKSKKTTGTAGKKKKSRGTSKGAQKNNEKKLKENIKGKDKKEKKFDRAAYEKELEEMRKLLMNESEENKLKEENYLGDYSYEEEDEEENEEISVEYNNLTDEIEKNLTRKNLQKCHVYLEKLGIQDLSVDPNKNIITVPFEFDDFEFLSFIIITQEWYLVKTSIFELDVLPKSSYVSLFKELLKANFVLNDVTYSLDPEEKSIWCEADIPSDVDFEHFKLEYLSIIFAIDYFFKNIAKDIKAEMHSTFKSNSSNNIYT
ncbi:MAG: type III secretion system chaperone [Promethearchaeota archaeon]